MSSRQWESHFGIMGWSGGFGLGAYTDGWSEGYEADGDHAEGATTIALRSGAGQLRPGSVLYFAGDDTGYTVTGSTGVAAVTSVTIAAPGLAGALLDGTALDPKLPAGPSDQMAYLLAGHLAADSALSTAVGGRIERMGIEPDEDFRQLPRVYVYPAGVTQEDVASIAEKICDVVVALVFALTNLKPASDGGATIASILTHVERIAASHDQMPVRLADGARDISLAERMAIQSYQTATLLDEKDRPLAFSQSIQFRYWAVCERGPERIFNLSHA